MAKKSQTSAENNIPQIEVEAILLTRFDSLQFHVDAGDTEEATPYIDVLSSPPTATDDSKAEGVYYGNVTFSCGRAASSNRTAVHAAAMYSFAFKTTARGEAAAQVASDIAASTTIWSHFVNLFGIVNMQMRSRLPILPSAPPSVKHATMDELIEVFDTFSTEPKSETDVE